MKPNMKKILNLLAVSALLVGAASCEVVQEDSFSTDPVAPEMVSHGDILITDNGCRFLGKERIPYHPADIEEFMYNNQ